MNLLREKQRALGYHPCVAAAMIGSAVVGGAISASGSKSAASTQANAANQATASQRGMFDTTVGLNSPFRQAGVGATSKLSTLLGIDNGGPQLVDTSSGVPAPNAQLYATNPAYRQEWDKALADHVSHFGTGYTKDSDASKIQSYLSTDPALAGQIPSASSDPDFGSLTKPFSMSDFQLDPGIQFQTQQGNTALINSMAAKDGVMSGGALKALIGYNQGMAGTGYQSAFDRYMAGKQFTLNSLMGVGQMGQAAASGVTSAAPNFSNGIAGTITGAGNASAAGTVGAANAISGGIQGAGNGVFLNSLLKNPNSDLGGPITTSANPGGVFIPPGGSA